MKLKVQELSVEETWKDIVRIRQSERVDGKGRIIERGAICLISVGRKSKMGYSSRAEDRTRGRQDGSER
jgi:hypothetical protein